MTLVKTATWGWNRSIASSWNEEISQTKSRGLFSERKPDSGAPMFPARATGRPARRSISAIQLAVVDLPLVPVTATQRFSPVASASAIRQAISISASTGMPSSRARAATGASRGTPGDIASHCAPSRTSRAGAPRKNRAPRSRNDPSSPRSDSERSSATDTATPRSSNACARARPLRANPITAIR